jgi:hypothetical protein
MRAQTRTQRAATLSAVGCVLLAVAGCADGGAEAGAEFTHQAAWSAVSSGPLDARYSPMSVWDGERYYVMGGYHDEKCGPSGDCSEADPPLHDGATYDPATDEWQQIADAPVGLDGHVVAVNGLIYVHTYPEWKGPGARFLSYDPAIDEWTVLPNPSKYGWLSATDEVPVIFADRGRDQSAFFDAEAARWRPLPDNPFWQKDAGYPAWTGSEFIVSSHTPSKMGSEPPLVKLVSLDADLRKWTDLGTTEIVGTAQVAVGDRVVWPSPEMANGGGDGTGDWGAIYPEGGIYDPATATWADIPPLPTRRGAYCCGSGTERLVSVYGTLLDPVTLEWTEVPPPEGGPRMYATRAAADNHALMWGGAAQDDPDQSLLDSGFLLRTVRD